MNEFIFFNEDGIDDLVKVIVLKKGIETKKDLFDIYSNKLKFPFYFGMNWDALNDCLLDLDWIKPISISIIHEDIPLTNEVDRKIYLELLVDISKKMNKDASFDLNICFPKIYQKMIEKILYIKEE